MAQRAVRNSSKPSANPEVDGKSGAKNQSTKHLHDEVDRLFEADTLVPAIAPADDAEFLRRVVLEFCGDSSVGEERSPRSRPFSMWGPSGCPRLISGAVRPRRHCQRPRPG